MNIRVVLPYHLMNLARVQGEVQVEVGDVATARTVMDALERRYPMLCGTIRDHGTLKRRPFIRFFVNREDWSLESVDRVLPESIQTGAEPFLVVGAMAGG
jgi:sulfur-carrier protein